MRGLRRLVRRSALASLLLLGFSSTASAGAAAHAPGRPVQGRVPAASAPSGAFADPGRLLGEVSARGSDRPGDLSRPYYRDDWRPRPRDLPRTGPLGSMLEGYRRTGCASPAAFLHCYWQTLGGMSGWWYPPKDGFVLDEHGNPVKQRLTLRAGQLVDLFGSGRGTFLAPAGTPYARRALPPSNLDTYDAAYPYGYHLYRVTEPFVVDAGPILPWFGQPGLGLQYKSATTIPDLVRAGNLNEIT